MTTNNDSFSARVYQQTKKIPRGYVTTYKALAQALNTKAYRAVGNALRNNPDAPQTPCHRVIRSDATLGGYAGKLNDNKKRDLLVQEGVTFLADGRVHPSCIHQF